MLRRVGVAWQNPGQDDGFIPAAARSGEEWCTAVPVDDASLHPRSSPRLDDVDRLLVHVLQERPRISWTSAGQVLGLSPTAVAARWRRLEGAGIAWIAVHPNVVAPDYLTAVVELGCLPADRAALADRLVHDGRIVTIDESSRGSDLLLTVIVPDLPTLSRFVLDDLTPMTGITSVRSSVVVGVFGTGHDWRVDALDEHQLARLHELGGDGAAPATELAVGSPPPVPDGQTARLPDDSWAIAQQLVRDGRMSVADLARAVDRNPATVRRHLASLLTSRRLSFRCDLQHSAVGLPVTATFFARIPPAEIPEALARLRRLPRLRMGLQVTGEATVIFSVLTQTVHDVARIQEVLGRMLPRAEVVESMVLLRSRKRMGWVLDEAGRRTGELVAPAVLGSILGGGAEGNAAPAKMVDRSTTS